MVALQPTDDDLELLILQGEESGLLSLEVDRPTVGPIVPPQECIRPVSRKSAVLIL